MMKLESRFLSTNFRKGRRATPDTIVIHVTEGTAASVIEWFNDPAAEVSAHYMVEKDGTIVAFVHEDDEAWAQGRVDHPTAAVVRERPTVNPNAYCISIEHEGDGTHELTDAQRASSVALIREIATRYKIPIDRRHIIGHHEIYAPKTCPGAISVDRLVQDVGAPGVWVTPTHSVPKIVYSPSLGDYLIVTRVAGDDDWSFVPAKSLPAGIKAGAPLSQMPEHP
jgi:N-acetyl-anhydromuramyl-L-alanine amidase AmpD